MELTSLHAQAAGAFEKLTLEYGLLGILLVLAMVAIIKLYNDLNKEKDARLQDMKDQATRTEAHTAALTEWTASQNERNRDIQRVTTAIERLADERGN